MKFEEKQFTANWNPEEYNFWSSSDLTEVLKQIRYYDYIWRSKFYEPKKAFEAKIKEDELNGSKFGFYIPATIFCAFFALLFGLTGSVIFFLFAAGTIISLVLGFRNLMVYRDKKTKNEERRKIQMEIDELEQTLMVWENQNIDFLTKTKKLLPNYYHESEALDFMIQALQNHRASTLSDAINLYEAEKKTNQILLSQLRTESHARKAASAAESAASAAAATARNADIAATNSIYNRSK